MHIGRFDSTLNLIISQVEPSKIPILQNADHLKYICVYVCILYIGKAKEYNKNVKLMSWFWLQTQHKLLFGHLLKKFVLLIKEGFRIGFIDHR